MIWQRRRHARRPPAQWPFRLAHKLPPVLLDQPWALFIKALCLISGATTFVGPAPGSIEATLPAPVVYLWSATLVIGASAGLYGLLRPHAWRVEIAGLIWLGTASVVYGLALLVRFQLDGAVATAIVVGFGAAALTRALAVHVTYSIATTVAETTGAVDPVADLRRRRRRQ